MKIILLSFILGMTPPIIQELVQKTTGSYGRCEETYGLDNNGNVWCNHSCGSGVDVKCTQGHSLWTCEVYLNGSLRGSASGWNNTSEKSPCTGT